MWPFTKIFYINKVSFNVNNVKTVNDTFSLTTTTKDISSYGQEVYISVFDKTKNIEILDYILWNYLSFILISFCINLFFKNKVIHFTKSFFSIVIIFQCFCKALNNSIHSDLKSRFKSSESITLQENLNNVKRNLSFAYFAIFKLRNEPTHFSKLCQFF